MWLVSLVALSLRTDSKGWTHQLYPSVSPNSSLCYSPPPTWLLSMQNSSPPSIASKVIHPNVLLCWGESLLMKEVASLVVSILLRFRPGRVSGGSCMSRHSTFLAFLVYAPGLTFKKMECICVHWNSLSVCFLVMLFGNCSSLYLVLSMPAL